MSNNLKEILGQRSLVRRFKKDGNTITETTAVKPVMAKPSSATTEDAAYIARYVSEFNAEPSHEVAVKKYLKITAWAGADLQRAVSQAITQKFGSLIPATNMDQVKGFYQTEYIANKPAIPLHHVVAQGYYIGYTPIDGVILIPLVMGFKGKTILRVLNKKDPRTRDDFNAAQNRMAGGVNQNGNYVLTTELSTFNNLDASEFRKIVETKPTFAMLQAGYRLDSVDTLATKNIMERLKKDTATVVL